MRKFNLELLQGKKVAVNCKTEEETQEFINWVCSLGKDVCNNNLWSDYKTKTGVRLNKNLCWEYAPINYYKAKGFKILFFEEALLKEENIDLNNTWCYATKENYEALLNAGVRTHFEFSEKFEYLSVNCHGDMWACKVYGRRQIHLVNGIFQFVQDDDNDLRQRAVVEKTVANHMINAKKEAENQFLSDKEIQDIITAKSECKICGETKDICPNEETCSYKIEFEDTKINENEKDTFNLNGFETPPFDGEILKKFDTYVIGYYNNFGVNTPTKWFNNGRCEKSREFDLIPIKKEWYDDENNFPKMVMQINCIDDKEIDMGLILFYNKKDFDKFGGDYRHLTKEEVLKLI